MIWGLGRLVAAAMAILMLTGAGWWYARQWQPSPDEYPVQGVDVDAASGAIHWGTARGQGVDFAYVVATMGDSGRDPGFEAHWAALPANGIRRGAVHVYSLCSPGIAQADHFNASVPRTIDALPVAVDFALAPDCAARPDRAALVAGVQAFLARVERHTGKPAILRVTGDFEEMYRLGDSIDRSFWGRRRFLPPDDLARGWRMWQASDLRVVEGFERPVNWNVAAP